MKILLPLLLFSFCIHAKTLPEERILEQAFYFLKQDDDRVSLEKWVVRVLQEFPTDKKLVELLVEYLVQERDRARIYESLRRVASRASCNQSKANNKQKAFCDDLNALWREGVATLPFYESTSGSLEEAKQKIKGQDCDAALSIVSDVETKEGALLQVLELKENIYICLGDKARLESTKKQRERLEVLR